MNKILKGVMTALMTFSLTGCFSTIYTKEASNDFSDTSKCVEVTNVDTLVDNTKNMMNKTNALTGTYTLTTNKQIYNLEFNAITNEKRIDWNLYAKTTIQDKAISVYLKEQKLYIIYPNNGANVILKDTMVNVVKEAKTTLQNLKAQYNEENLENLLMGNKLEGFDFQMMKDKGSYVLNGDIYTLTLENNGLVWEYDIDKNTYLIEETRCTGEGFNSVLKFNFPKKISITYPMGLDFLTMNIEDVKEILEVTSFSELLEPNVDVEE
ncbi:MAG: hypothetical protein IKJ30_06230 [Bacilli bacterium]|nr:hypothetical protein [Bacilli bacterium]